MIDEQNKIIISLKKIVNCTYQNYLHAFLMVRVEVRVCLEVLRKHLEMNVVDHHSDRPLLHPNQHCQRLQNDRYCSNLRRYFGLEVMLNRDAFSANKNVSKIERVMILFDSCTICSRSVLIIIFYLYIF